MESTNTEAVFNYLNVYTFVCKGLIPPLLDLLLDTVFLTILYNLQVLQIYRNAVCVCILSLHEFINILQFTNPFSTVFNPLLIC